jgi:hypothetical protein
LLNLPPYLVKQISVVRLYFPSKQFGGAASSLVVGPLKIVSEGPIRQMPLSALVAGVGVQLEALRACNPPTAAACGGAVSVREFSCWAFSSHRYSPSIQCRGRHLVGGSKNLMGFFNQALAAMDHWLIAFALPST